MSISLYDSCVPSYLQLLQSVAGILQKGKDYCSAEGLDLEALPGAQLIDDMAPLAFQIVSVHHHSIGALNGAREGVFSAPGSYDGMTYDDLVARVNEAIAAVEAVTPEEVNALEGKDMIFVLGDLKLPFVVEDFISSFSQPNFYFHATTAYDILRMKGVPLGKRDYLGAIRLKA